MDSLLIFGGAYGNLEALQALKAKAEALQIPPSRVFNSGDTVAYGADPVATLDLLIDWDIHNIAGNVEIQLAEDEDDCGCGFSEGSVCDRLSQQWYPYLKSRIQPHHIDWMKTLPRFLKFEFAGKSVALVHGSFQETSRFVFHSTPWPVKQEEFEAAEVDIILAGHCGLPFVDGHDAKVWANSGALGLPANDGTPRVWALLLRASDCNITFETFAIDYDFEKAQAKMRAVPQLKTYAETLSSGLWPSCDVLTPEELAKRGKELHSAKIVFDLH